MDKSLFAPEHLRLCDALRDLRETAGLRQADLADLLQVNQTAVSKWERGERRLDLIELRQVVEALGSTLTRFVTEFERNRPQPK